MKIMILVKLINLVVYFWLELNLIVIIALFNFYDLYLNIRFVM